MSLRSPMGRVLGLGAAKEGVSHWWSQRVTAVALLLLTLWFVVVAAAAGRLQPRSGRRAGSVRRSMRCCFAC